MDIYPDYISTERVLEIINNAGVDAELCTGGVVINGDLIRTEHAHEVLYGLMFAVDSIKIRGIIHASVRQTGS